MAAENVMEVVSQIGAGVTDSLAYLGALATLGTRAAYYTFIGPFQGKPLRVQSAASQAMEVGVRALANPLSDHIFHWVDFGVAERL